MRVDTSVFIATSGAIATLLISILSVLISQVRWQERTAAKIAEHDKAIDDVTARVHSLEIRGVGKP